jgi:hypothetical protein
MENTNNNLENFNKEEFNSFVKEALSQIKKINDSYQRLFEAKDGKESIISEIESRLEDVKQKYEHLFLTDESGLSRVAELNTQIDQIKNHHKELLEGDESIQSDIKESQDKITDFYIYLFGGSEGIEGQEQKVKSAIEDIVKFHEEVTKENGYQKTIEDSHKKIIELHDELFFTSELENESKSEKLKKEIDNISQFNIKVESEIKGFISDTGKNIKTKTKEINSLLSNATAKTLGQGYLESMENHGFIGLKNNELTKEVIFKFFYNGFINLLNYCLFIIPLVLIGFVFIEPEFVKKFLSVNDLGGSRLEGTQYILYKISVSLPLFWISWYGQRNIAHKKRLFEEYNHKLRVVQMYLLFISKENSYSITQMTRLENILLEVINRNPVEVYGKDDTVIDKIIEAIKANKGIASDVIEKTKNTVSDTVKKTEDVASNLTN